jgi:dipeptidase D
MKSPHSTSERVLIETVAPFWELLKKVLEDIPEKE